MALVRITVTVPHVVLKEADRRARALDRSRSWVVSEALRRFLEVPVAGQPEAPRVREVRVVPYQAGLGASRLAQLEADLALTPEQRVLEAERTAAETQAASARPRTRAIRSFDRYEDFLDWQSVQVRP